MKAASIPLLVSTLALAAGCGRGAPSPPPVTSARAPPTAAAQATDLPAGERRRLAGEVARLYEAQYVLPEVGARMAAAIREHAARGDYDGLAGAADFAKAVTEHLRDVSHNRHAMLEHTPPRGAKTPEDERFDRRMEESRRASGFGAVERLPGNVARLAMTSFQPVDAARDAVTKRLSEVADADALIVDLRDNFGGDPATVALVASYLFDATPVHLNDMFWRESGNTVPSFTLRDVPGKRFGPKKPVFVLTSHDTFSAGEEFAYDLQSLHRGVVVGEATGGGAHPVAPHPLGHDLTLRIPVGRAINPVTKTNWEGVGVAPDVPVPASDALHEAHARALRAVLAAPGLPADRRRAAQAALDALGAEAPKGG